jgi:hypothetical protein
MSKAKKKFRVRKKKFYTDSKGNTFPAENMKPNNILKQWVNDRLVPKALKLNKLLTEFKKEITDVCWFYQDRLAKNYKTKIGEFNVSVSAFDGKSKVGIKSQPYIVYDPTSLSIAQRLMGDVISEGTSGVNQALRQLFLDAFSPKESSINITSIEQLCSYNIPHPKWQQAVNALQEGKSVAYRKEYPLIQVRGKNNELLTIHLDIAKV